MDQLDLYEAEWTQDDYYAIGFYLGKMEGDKASGVINVLLAAKGVMKLNFSLQTGSGSSGGTVGSVLNNDGTVSLIGSRSYAIADSTAGALAEVLGNAASTIINGPNYEKDFRKYQESVDRLNSAKEPGKGDSNTPDNVNYDSKQVGKKYGEHMKDYPDMKDYTEYKDYADEIFKSPDQIIHDAKNGEFYYTKGNDLLRIKENGDFVSLYPGAESGRVLDAISNGGVVWP